MRPWKYILHAAGGQSHYPSVTSEPQGANNCRIGRRLCRAVPPNSTSCCHDSPSGENSLTSSNGIVKLRVERAVPVISPAYDMGANEADLREAWMAHFAGLQSHRIP